jgi:hypothetical protein
MNQMNNGQCMTPAQLLKLADEIERLLDRAEKLALAGQRTEARTLLEEANQLMQRCYGKGYK